MACGDDLEDDGERTAFSGGADKWSAMDLKDPRLIYLKGALFAVILALGAVGIVVITPDWRVVVLLALVIWSSARLYYFMFYVIEKYVDPTHRFAGVGACLVYLMGRKKI